MFLFSIQHPALQVNDNAQGVRVVENFIQLHLRKDVTLALSSIGVVQPTVIQMLAIPKIQRGKNVLCAAETGNTNPSLVVLTCLTFDPL